MKYWFTQTNEHSLHSPFVFKLYTELIKTSSVHVDPDIEALRKELLKENQKIRLTDLGAGSRVTKAAERKVSDIARNASSPKKFSALLSALIEELDFEHILELGTSLGLNSLYLSKSDKVKLTTFEGDPELQRIANQNFTKFNRKNIQLIQGDINETLSPFLNQLKQIDLAYIDANHSYKPTLHYYKSIQEKCHCKSLVIIDDIHWSGEMHKAWTEIKNRPEVSVSIDLFEAGLLFFDQELTKGDYILEF